MNPTPARCLILACGNTLREDDGVGPWLAPWAEDRFASEPTVRVLARQQWTPDLAEDIAAAECVLFLDCSIDSAPGAVSLAEVAPASPGPGLATHHIGAPELLALERDLYAAQPRSALLLTVGAGSTELGETFSSAVIDALPEACNLLELTVQKMLNSSA
jgi:hydrogenase maturation protease